MGSNEIMTTNEEVIAEVTEEIANTDSGKVTKVIAGAGLVVLAGVAVYKFVIKPLRARAKAKKETDAVFADYEYDDSTEESYAEVETID